MFQSTQVSVAVKVVMSCSFMLAMLTRAVELQNRREVLCPASTRITQLF